MIGILILLAPKGLPARWIGLILFIPLFNHQNNNLNDHEFELTLLDIGQGLSIVVETKKHTLVFDTGAKYSKHYDMGNAVVIPFLKSKAITQVDTLLISHADNDHIGGTASIMKQINVKKVISSVPEKLSAYQATFCHSGMTWQWDSINFEIISPNQGILKGDNNNSCVLKIHSQYGSALLTGDIESTAEKWLLTYQPEKLTSDLLISPHHGSKSSSSWQFLQAVQAKTILISTGYKNRFAFPHQEVLSRYDRMQTQWLDTATQGAITVKVTFKKTLVSPLRLKNRHYWNR